MKRAFETTVNEEYPDMDWRQRAAFLGAAAISLSRPVVAAIDMARPKDQTRGWPDTIKDTVVAASDGLDGYVARKGNAATRLGGWLDQLVGDKAYMALKEADMTRRGQLGLVDTIARTTRDIAVTAARQYVSSKSEGKVDVKARNGGKASTFVRMATDILLDSPAADKLSPGLKRTVALGSTALLVYSGVRNIIDYRRALTAWQQDQQETVL